jgi:hypothetical protein
MHQVRLVLASQTPAELTSCVNHLRETLCSKPEACVTLKSAPWTLSATKDCLVKIMPPTLPGPLQHLHTAPGNLAPYQLPIAIECDTALAALEATQAIAKAVSECSGAGLVLTG